MSLRRPSGLSLALWLALAFSIGSYDAKSFLRFQNHPQGQHHYRGLFLLMSIMLTLIMTPIRPLRCVGMTILRDPLMRSQLPEAVPWIPPVPWKPTKCDAKKSLGDSKVRVNLHYEIQLFLLASQLIHMEVVSTITITFITFTTIKISYYYYYY